MGTTQFSSNMIDVINIQCGRWKWLLTYVSLMSFIHDSWSGLTLVIWYDHWLCVFSFSRTSYSLQSVFSVLENKNCQHKVSNIDDFDIVCSMGPIVETHGQATKIYNLLMIYWTKWFKLYSLNKSINFHDKYSASLKRGEMFKEHPVWNCLLYSLTKLDAVEVFV